MFCMRHIRNILSALKDGKLRQSLQEAKQFAAIEQTLWQVLADKGFAELSCQCLSLKDGALQIGTPRPADAARLRQMQSHLLTALQTHFPQLSLSHLSFHIQP